MPERKKTRLGILGLGYVGLPLAVEFAKQFATVGFDLKPERIAELQNKKDATREVSEKELQQAKHLKFTNKIDELKTCNVFIVAVPTPIDTNRRPNLRPLISASQTIAQVIKKDDVVIYESTVFPGATEEVCVPIIEQEAGLRFNVDFFVGYSPERINPGDQRHRLPTIKKVTSGSTPETAEFVDQLYASIITAGTFKASSIRVAEAAKVIENTQRDVNIALINELALIFNRLEIDTLEVLEAAGTKWNFLPFRPGLVGGHCIGVDPYYLTHKAQEVGYHPEMILAGRRLNDNMGRYIASCVIKLMLKKCIHVAKSNTLILGLTFKENCPDLRNTRVIDIIEELEQYGAQIEVDDPWMDQKEAEQLYGVTLAAPLGTQQYDCVILAVAHEQYTGLTTEKIRRLCKDNAVIYDVKHVLPKEIVDGAL